MPLANPSARVSTAILLALEHVEERYHQDLHVALLHSMNGNAELLPDDVLQYHIEAFARGFEWGHSAARMSRPTEHP